MVQVFCDRHYGGINYPRGGVGRIGELLVEGLQERGSYIEYKANVSISAFTASCCTAAVDIRVQNLPQGRDQAVATSGCYWTGM